METLEFFRGVDLFKFLSEDQLEHVTALARVVSFPDGNIIRDSDAADGLYIVKSGMAKVTKSSTDNAGVEAVLAILRQGTSFGEISLIDGLPRSANVTAMGPIECFFLPREAFLLTLEQTPEIALGMLLALASMVRNTDQWLAQLI